MRIILIKHPTLPWSITNNLVALWLCVIMQLLCITNQLQLLYYVINSIGNSKRVIFRIGIKLPRALCGCFVRFRMTTCSAKHVVPLVERQWKLKEIESIPEYWSEMSRRSPGKRESLDSLTDREISLTRSCRNLSALIKWEISPVYWNRSFVQSK